MDNQDLIKQIAEETGFSVDKASDALETIFKVIAKALKEGETIKLDGIGSFFVTGSKFEMVYQEEQDDISSKKKVKFIADKELLTGD